MKMGLASLFLLIFTSVSAGECDCSVYPFRPNPPCYRICVAQLVSSDKNSIAAVENITPRAYRNLKILIDAEDAHRRNINFSNINGIEDLEKEARKTLDLNQDN